MSGLNDLSQKIKALQAKHGISDQKLQEKIRAKRVAMFGFSAPEIVEALSGLSAALEAERYSIGDVWVGTRRHSPLGKAEIGE